MGAISAEMAFVENEFLDLPGVALQAPMLFDEGLQIGGRPVPASEGDVRVEGAALGREAGRLASAFDLLRERLQLVLWRQSRPKRAAVSPVEAADAVERDVECVEADAFELGRQILGNRPFDLADEAQGQVQLVFFLPAQSRHALHQVEQLVPHFARRSDRGEQAMHGQSVSRNGEGPRPVSLEQQANISDIGRGSTGP